MDYYQHQISDFTKDIKIRKLPMVYVLSTPDFEFIKVGKTNSPKERFTNIQSGCPFKLILWLAIRTPKEKELEKVIHHRLAHCRVRGEWFAPDTTDLDDLLSFFKLTNANVREVSNALL